MNNTKQYALLLIAAVAMSGTSQTSAMLRKLTQFRTSFMPRAKILLKNKFQNRFFCSKKNTDLDEDIKKLVEYSIDVERANEKINKLEHRFKLEHRLRFGLWGFSSLKDRFYLCCKKFGTKRNLLSRLKSLFTYDIDLDVKSLRPYLSEAEKNDLAQRALSGKVLNENEKKDLRQKAYDRYMGKIIKCYTPNKDIPFYYSFLSAKSNISKCCSKIDKFDEDWSESRITSRIDYCTTCIENMLKECSK